MSDGTFSWPAYQYILTDRLDEQALTSFPSAHRWPRKAAGHYRVWIYGEEGQRRIRALLEPAVREKLGPKRAPTL